MTNEQHKKIIEDLNEKVKQFNDENSNSSKARGDCEHGEEMEKMKEMTEKVKEPKNTNDLKIKKLKEQHLEEIN